MISIVYDSLYDNLHSFIQKKHYIPYKILSSDTKFKEEKRYYIDYYRQTMKVISIEYDKYNIMSYCYVKWDDGNYGAYCSDLSVINDYIMEQDTDSIYKIPDIFNTPDIYTGAEIRYWLFMNNITATSEKYSQIWPKLEELLSKSENDYNRYKLNAFTDSNNNYCDIYFSKIDRSKIIPG